jgi:TldD protein
MSALTIRTLRSPLPWILFLLTLFSAVPARGQQSAMAANSSSSKAASSDPVLQAMREELDRSKSHLKMDNVPAPYYIEYRLSDVEQYDAEAAFGALREEQRVHTRIVRVVVRVGDYK